MDQPEASLEEEVTKTEDEMEEQEKQDIDETEEELEEECPSNIDDRHDRVLLLKKKLIMMIKM